jgi:hypothetical protein
MTEQPSKRGFVLRPGDPEAWVRTPEGPLRPAAANEFSARLTIDVTPELRGRIKVTAFRRGVTVAEMLRTLFEREFPDDAGAPS